jgi:hypothetical protein
MSTRRCQKPARDSYQLANDAGSGCVCAATGATCVGASTCGGVACPTGFAPLKPTAHAAARRPEEPRTTASHANRDAPAQRACYAVARSPGQSLVWRSAATQLTRNAPPLRSLGLVNRRVWLSFAAARKMLSRTYAQPPRSHAGRTEGPFASEPRGAAHHLRARRPRHRVRRPCRPSDQRRVASTPRRLWLPVPEPSSGSFAVIVAMTAVRMVQMARHEVVGVSIVRHGFMLASSVVLVASVVTTAGM